MFSRSIIGSLPFLSLAAAHFRLDYPAARGFDEDILGTFPCGGQNQVLSNRTTVSTQGFPVALTMGHDEAAVEVLLGLGDNPGDNFNIVLHQTFREQGLGSFCLSEIMLPSGLDITDGQNATLQVITSGDSGGGLYNCADITFTTETVTSPSTCTNGTGVTAIAFSGAAAARNANESTPEGQAQSGGSSSTASASSSVPASSASSSSTPSSNSGTVTAVSWGVFAAAIIGAVAAL